MRREFRGHFVQTVRQRGWAGLRNSDLLRRAAAGGFEVLVTADQNLQFQQNLAGSALVLIVLGSRSTKFEDLLPLIPSALEAIREARPGEIRRVGSA